MSDIGTLCWVLPDVGHYHHARISALAMLGRMGIVVLSIGGISGFREFRLREDAAGSYRLRTLFPQDFYADLPPRRVKIALHAELQHLAPAVVLIQGWSESYSLAALDWCLKTQTPAIVTSESQITDFPRSAWKEHVKRRVIAGFRSALVGGKPHVEYLAQLGMPRERIFTGYDVVDNAHFASGADAARADASAVRARLNLPERFFLASGRFIEKKNFPRLLQAYTRYRDAVLRTAREPLWSLVLLGDGELRPELERLRAGLGLAEHVLLPGFKGYQELPAFYGLASAFVHPSTTEQWGLVVNEAMATGLPVLVSKPCGCAPDLVEEGRNGWTFDPSDVGALSELMVRVSAMTPADRSALGAASRQIIGCWTPEHFGTGLLEAARIALATPAPRRGLVDRALLRLLSR
jgi:glycosyltransferase involved in cell wall biosynthesis